MHVVGRGRRNNVGRPRAQVFRIVACARHGMHSLSRSIPSSWIIGCSFTSSMLRISVRRLIKGVPQSMHRKGSSEQSTFTSLRSVRKK